MESSPTGSSVHGILQARILEWVAIPASRGSSQTRDWTCIFCTADRFFIAESPEKPLRAWYLNVIKWKGASHDVSSKAIPMVQAYPVLYWWSGGVAQSCLTLCDPIACSPPGSSVHGIFQARALEWAAISFSMGSSQPRDRTGSPTW